MLLVTDFEARVAQFESAWQTGGRPEISQFLNSPEEADHGPLLAELVMIDLEYRCRASAANSTPLPQLETYVKQFPQLGPLHSVSCDLVAEEYLARQRFGDRPTRAEYRARFPRHGDVLERAFDRADLDLAAEGVLVVRPPAVAFAAISDEPLDDLLDYRDFALKRQIGTGGMCRVYTAIQKSLDRPVAVKVLKRRLQADPIAVERFLSELRLTQRAKHANVVQVYGAGRLPAGGYFLAIELIVGQDLARLAAETPLAAREAVRIVESAARTMAHVHQAGVVHCDLKPSNLLIESGGRVVVSDFGLAREIAGEGEVGIPQGIAGTLAYMAPEQRSPAWRPHPAADVYALGGVLRGLLTDNPPDWLAQICGRCMAESAEERYTAPELADALHAGIVGSDAA